MNRRAVLLLLGVIATGLFLTAFGTQTTQSSQQVYLVYGPHGVQTMTCYVRCGFDLPNGMCALYGPCAPYSEVINPPQPDYTLNLFGAFVAVLGAIGFAALYPLSGVKSSKGRILTTLN